MATYVKPSTRGEEPPPNDETIAQWEAEYGLQLPPDYRIFLLRYNGGFVYPLKFPGGYPADHPYYEENNELTLLDCLYPWLEFLEHNGFKQFWNQRQYASIGDSICGTVLIKLVEPDYGSVHSWWRNNEPWDSDEECITPGYIAPSFRVFIQETLREGDSMTSRWDQPDAFDEAREIRFD